MHELAKSLPPPRRQNVACDACRSVGRLLSVPWLKEVDCCGCKVAQGQMHDPPRLRKGECWSALVKKKFLMSFGSSVRFVLAAVSLHLARWKHISFSPLALHIQELQLHVRALATAFHEMQLPLILFRHFVQQATSEKKRGAGTNRRARASTSASHSSHPTYATHHDHLPLLPRPTHIDALHPLSHSLAPRLPRAQNRQTLFAPLQDPQAR